MRTHTFRDGTRAELSVSAPWWSWLWLGLIYQPAEGHVSVRKERVQTVRQWWCLWLCTSEERVWVDEPASITIEAKGYTNVAAQQVTDQGIASCGRCSSLSHFVHNLGFPLPPFAGGGGFQGVGFRATVRHGDESVVLSGHWGDRGTLPPDFAD
jgi:hypothetical protein